MAGRRRRVRAYEHPKRFTLFSADKPLGPDVIRRLSYEEGMKLVDGRKARAIAGESDKDIVAFQMFKDEAPKKQPELDGSHASSTAFSGTELDAIVGVYGPSQTAGLNEMGRRSRAAKGLAETDFVEETREKLRAYTQTH